MRYFFTIVIISVSLNTFSQDFAPIGAVWHYSYATINPNMYSFKTLESLADTTISGTVCKKILEVERLFDTTQTKLHFMYSNNDSVFFYKDSAFHLIYDFGAVTGDTIELGYYTTNTGQPLQMTIDSTSIIFINGINKTVQHVTCGDGISIEFGDRIIEDIGNVFFLFPRGDLDPNGPLRCYQDSLLGLFVNPYHSGPNWNMQDCDQIYITDVEEINNEKNISVYPNPASDYLHLKNVSTPFYFRIINAFGEIVLTGNQKNTYDLNIEVLPRGIYIIEITNKRKTSSAKFTKE